MPKRTSKKKRKGNCYVTAEALFHLLGGKNAGYVPHTVRHEGAVHWYLVHYDGHNPDDLSPDEQVFVMHLGELGSGRIIDPTASQFKAPPPYHLGRGRGFLTKGPSKRARAMMETMVWQPGS